MDNLEDLVTKLKEILLPKQEILVAYLYGSILGEEWTNRSDIDIALYVNESVSKDLWFRVDLQEELNTLGIPSTEQGFDIRTLNSATPKFCYEVVYKGKCILARDESFRTSFECQSLLDWYDMRPTWENYYQELNRVLRK